MFSIKICDFILSPNYKKNYFFFLNNKFIVRIKYLKHKKTSLNLIQKIHLNKNFK